MRISHFFPGYFIGVAISTVSAIAFKLKHLFWPKQSIQHKPLPIAGTTINTTPSQTERKALAVATPALAPSSPKTVQPIPASPTARPQTPETRASVSPSPRSLTPIREPLAAFSSISSDSLSSSSGRSLNSADTLATVPSRIQPQLQVSEVPGNGNCLYAALGYGFGKNAQQIREEATKSALQNFTEGDHTTRASLTNAARSHIKELIFEKLNDLTQIENIANLTFNEKITWIESYSTPAKDTILASFLLEKNLSIPKYISSLTVSQFYENQLTFWKEIESRNPELGESISSHLRALEKSSSRLKDDDLVLTNEQAISMITNCSKPDQETLLDSFLALTGCSIPKYTDGDTIKQFYDKQIHFWCELEKNLSQLEDAVVMNLCVAELLQDRIFGGSVTLTALALAYPEHKIEIYEGNSSNPQIKQTYNEDAANVVRLFFNESRRHYDALIEV